MSSLNKRETRRDKFVEYFKENVEKHLFRIAKENGFYHKLKSVLNPDKRQNHDYLLIKTYYKAYEDVEYNVNKVFDPKYYCSVKKAYPVRCGIKSDLHLSHMICLSILQNCNLADSKIMTHYNELTNKMFKGHKAKAFLVERKCWLRLLFST